MRQLARLTLVLIGALCLGAATGQAQEPAAAPPVAVPQVILVQTSGWMEPFYSDSRSRLRPLVKDLAQATGGGAPEVLIAGFNQNGQVPGQVSPNLLYRGGYDAGQVGQAVDSLSLPRKASGAYADTDLGGAVLGAIKMLNGGDGLIWVVTNNKNSPDNSDAVDANTLKFYRDLQSSPSITALAAFLVINPVQGKFSERGLVVYGIAKGPGGQAALEALLAADAPLRARTFKDNPPVRLKPLGYQPVRFKVKRILTRQGEKIAVRGDQRGVLTVSGVQGGKAAVFRIEGELSNSLYPFTIGHAKVDTSWTALQGAGGRLASEAQLRVSPDRISGLRAIGPGAVTPVTLDVALPALQPPAGSWLKVITAEHAVLRGEVQVRLSEVDLDFDPAFLARAYDLLRVDPGAANPEADLRQRLPEIFYGHEAVRSTTTTIPVELQVEFSAWPLILVGLLVLLLVALIILAVWWMTRPVLWRSPSLGQSLRLKPGERIERDTPMGKLEIVRPLIGEPRETLLTGKDKA